MRPWPETAKGQHQLNLVLGWCWFAFGVAGLLDFMLGKLGGPSLHVTQSIPVLFAISVYANFVGHLSAAQAARAEHNTGGTPT